MQRSSTIEALRGENCFESYARRSAQLFVAAHESPFWPKADVATAAS